MLKLILLFTLAFPVFSSETETATAAAFTGAGIAQLYKGNVDTAKDWFYRALANDISFGPAEYQLGLLCEKENKKPEAAHMFNRACQHLPAGAQRTSAQNKLRALEPLQARLSIALDEYARGLEAMNRRNLTDPDLEEELFARGEVVKKTGVLPDSRPTLIKNIVTPPAVTGTYVYKGPWWTSDFEIKADKSFMRLAFNIGGTWYIDEKTNALHLIHTDATHDVLLATKDGYANKRITLTRK